jgi:hypothetical protein
MENPWNIWMAKEGTDIDDKNCEFYPIQGAQDTGLKNSCTYQERVGAYCYFANE